MLCDHLGGPGHRDLRLSMSQGWHQPIRYLCCPPCHPPPMNLEKKKSDPWADKLERISPSHHEGPMRPFTAQRIKTGLVQPLSGAPWSYEFFQGIMKGLGTSQVVLMVKNPPAVQEILETWVQSLGWEDPLEKEMATHSSIFAWRISWTEEPGSLPSMWPHPRGSSRISS